MKEFPFYAKLALVVLLALALAEAMPEVVNAFLVLVLLGILLSHPQAFGTLARLMGSVSKGTGGK